MHRSTRVARWVASSPSTRLLSRTHLTARQRLYYSTHPDHTPASTTRWSTFALGSLASGVLGYGLAQWVSKSPHKESERPLSTTPSNTPLNDQYGSQEDFQNAIRELHDIFAQEEKRRGELVTTDPAVLAQHGQSFIELHVADIPHSVVVYPRSTEDVVKIVKVVNKYRMPITPYAGATSLEGHTRGHALGGICIDMSNMDQILEIHEADSDLVCQAGVSWTEINETLKDKGIPLFFPLDPGPGATMGGMLSTGCSGTNAVRYGTAKAEWFLNATVVLPSGEVIKTRRRSRKSSAGFDTTKLFIGAEGTLGIVTEVTIRLAPLLPTTVAIVNFPDVKKATEAVIEILNHGAGIQCVELVDDLYIAGLNKFSQRKYTEKDHLFFKFQGPTQASLKETAEIVKKTVEKHGGKDFVLAKDQDEADSIWDDRKSAHIVPDALIPGTKGMPTDVCVPISRLPDLVYDTKRDLKELGLIAPVVGHVGDGNFHTMILFSDNTQLEAVKEASRRMVKRALALDGTCSGEHGIGLGKKEYLVEELGEGTVELMRSIKRTIDPLNLFNPGKLYPDPVQKGK